MARVRQNGLTAAVQTAVDVELDLLDAGLSAWRLLLGDGPFGSGGDGDADGDGFLTERQREIRADLDDVRQLLRRLFASGANDEFFLVLHELSANRNRLERAFVVWIDLIEVLVQNAERDFGAVAGQGLLKASQVKAALSYILSKQKFDLPNISPILRPVIIDIAVGWFIDAVVLACNGYGLWVAESQKAPTLLERFKAAVMRAFEKIVAFLLNTFARFIVWLWSFRDSATVLTPRLRSSLDAVMREGLMAQGGHSIFQRAVSLLRWLAEHRNDAIRTFEMVLEAVQQAESFLTMSGSEKKAYARDLVIAVMAELGYQAQSGLVHAIVTSFVDAAIEVAVHLFNKRGVFDHAA